jgi:hypothetical protein|tara:strand:+ start:1732 stop:1980 length:249 start_codon:yes stop_codon:yes gene_type:complete
LSLLSLQAIYISAYSLNLGFSVSMFQEVSRSVTYHIAAVSRWRLYVYFFGIVAARLVGKHRLSVHLALVNSRLRESWGEKNN